MNYDTQAYISMLNKACEDWAEDHSAVQRLARLCGVSESEIHGGGYFVGIQPLVELCEQRVKSMQELLVEVAASGISYEVEEYYDVHISRGTMQAIVELTTKLKGAKP